MPLRFELAIGLEPTIGLELTTGLALATGFELTTGLDELTIVPPVSELADAALASASAC